MFVYFFSYLILAVFFILERFVRRWDDTKNMDRTIHDKGSTTFISIVMGMAFILLSISPLLNWFGIGALHHLGIGVTGLILGTCGLVVRYLAFNTLGRFFSRTLREAENHTLVTCGIYKFVRHPGYLSDFLIFIGVALAMNSLIAIIAIPPTFIAAYTYRIYTEEKMLIGIFGEQYCRYQKTSKRLIPFIF